MKKILFLVSLLVASTVGAQSVLDPSFNTVGFVTQDFYDSFDEAYDLVLQPDGKIVVVAGAHESDNDFLETILLRYNSDGTLDASFGNTGIVKFNFDSADVTMYGLAMQADGKFVTVGYGEVGFYNNLFVMRFNINGTVDNSFGTNGIVQFSVGTSSSYGRDVVIQPDGKIVIAVDSYTDATTQTDAGAVRLNSDGTPDTGFGTAGISLTDINEDGDEVKAVILQPDGKILLCGQ